MYRVSRALPSATRALLPPPLSIRLPRRWLSGSSAAPLECGPDAVDVKAAAAGSYPLWVRLLLLPCDERACVN
jgi:hypothetical protein